MSTPTPKDPRTNPPSVSATEPIAAPPTAKPDETKEVESTKESNHFPFDRSSCSEYPDNPRPRTPRPPPSALLPIPSVLALSLPTELLSATVLYASSSACSPFSPPKASLTKSENVLPLFLS